MGCILIWGYSLAGLLAGIGFCDGVADVVLPWFYLDGNVPESTHVTVVFFMVLCLTVPFFLQFDIFLRIVNTYSPDPPPPPVARPAGVAKHWVSPNPARISNAKQIVVFSLYGADGKVERTFGIDVDENMTKEDREIPGTCTVGGDVLEWSIIQRRRPGLFWFLRPRG